MYADPPWAYDDPGAAGKRGARYKYNVLSVPEIAKLECWDWCADTCFLAMWYTFPLTQDALDLVKYLGFRTITTGGFVWIKTTAKGKYSYGMGNWTRANPECVLFARKGKIKRADASVPALVFAPRRKHSEKPDEVADKLVKLVGDQPKIELFARKQRPGWDCWGDQLSNVTESPKEREHRELVERMTHAAEARY